jgi:chemotaxis protein histidine kinase CheA
MSQVAYEVELAALATCTGTHIGVLNRDINTLETLVGAYGSLDAVIRSGVAANEVNTITGALNSIARSIPAAYTDTQATSAANAAITAWVGAAPGALDTIIELGAALAANGDLITAISSLIANKVDFSVAQNLTEAQKQQARDNIGAISQAQVTLIAQAAADAAQAAAALDATAKANAAKSEAIAAAANDATAKAAAAVSTAATDAATKATAAQNAAIAAAATDAATKATDAQNAAIAAAATDAATKATAAQNAAISTAATDAATKATAAQNAAKAYADTLFGSIPSPTVTAGTGCAALNAAFNAV